MAEYTTMIILLGFIIEGSALCVIAFKLVSVYWDRKYQKERAIHAGFFERVASYELYISKPLCELYHAERKLMDEIAQAREAITYMPAALHHEAEKEINKSCVELLNMRKKIAVLQERQQKERQYQEAYRTKYQLKTF